MSSRTPFAEFTLPKALRGLVLLALALLPFCDDLYLVTQFSMLLVYGMFAMSLSLVWGYAGLLCFGHAVFFGLGAYAMAMVSKGMIPGLTGPLASTAMGLMAAIACNALFAWVLGWFLFHGRLSGPYLGIVTLAISVLAEQLFINWYYTGGYNGISAVPPISLAGWELSDPKALYWFLFLVALAVYIFLRRVTRSPFGGVMAAIKHNEARAESFGFNIVDYKIRVFVLGACVAGLAGALFAVAAEFVSPTELGFKMSTEVLIWTALGGREVLMASFLGAVLVRFLELRLSEMLAEYWILILGFFFIVCVVFFPGGLAGKILADKPKA